MVVDFCWLSIWHNKQHLVFINLKAVRQARRGGLEEGRIKNKVLLWWKWWSGKGQALGYWEWKSKLKKTGSDLRWNCMSNATCCLCITVKSVCGSCASNNCFRNKYSSIHILNLWCITHLLLLLLIKSSTFITNLYLLWNVIIAYSLGRKNNPCIKECDHSPRGLKQGSSSVNLHVESGHFKDPSWS